MAERVESSFEAFAAATSEHKQTWECLQRIEERHRLCESLREKKAAVVSQKQSLVTECTEYKTKLFQALQNVDESSLKIILCQSEIAVLENQAAATQGRLRQCREYTASSRQEHRKESLKLLNFFRELSISEAEQVLLAVEADIGFLTQEKQELDAAISTSDTQIYRAQRELQVATSRNQKIIQHLDNLNELLKVEYASVDV